VGSSTERTAVPRTPLSRARVIGEAVALADENGIGALTMRRLADRLLVEPMSLYHHVANKDEILDGMVDVVFGEITLPSIDADWKNAMRERATSARAALRRRPLDRELAADCHRPALARVPADGATVRALGCGQLRARLAAHVTAKDHRRGRRGGLATPVA
jgi:AcrR family transcriptional regulator